MLDKIALPLFEKVLSPLGPAFAKAGIKPEFLIVAGFGSAVLASIFVSLGLIWAGFFAFIVFRLLDGAALATAQVMGMTAFGKYLGLFFTLGGFGAVILGFGFLGDANALIAALLIFGLMAWGGSTLAYAGVARGLKMKSEGSTNPTTDFMAGLIGQTEMTLGLFLMFLFPQFFPAIAAILAILVFLVTIFRVLKARLQFWQ